MVTTEEQSSNAIDVEIENMVWEVEDDPKSEYQYSRDKASAPYAEAYEQSYEAPYAASNEEAYYGVQPARVINKHLFTWVFSLVLGIYGVDRFLRGQIGLGVLKILTFGGFGIWYLADLGIAAYKSYVSDYKEEENLAFDYDGRYI